MLQFLIWIYGATAVILLAELIMGRHKGAYTRSDIPLLIMSFISGRALIGPLMVSLIAAIYGLALPHWKGAMASTPFWIAFPALLLFEEFVFYWVHRWAHENRGGCEQLLWKLHRTHHSGRHMNVVLQARVNLFWYVVIPSGWTLGLGLYLGMATAAAAVSVTLVAWNTVTHSNFRWDDAVRKHPAFGPAFRALEHVFVSPGIHHTHHGYGKDGAGYRNFGTVLSLWDWLFGTLHIPQGRPWRYGNPGPTAHWTEELFYPLVGFGKRQKPNAQ
jgi:sterol desaturase/sphingolipid hydroxylase (fatty acid hydroxylase superfamily)